MDLLELRLLFKKVFTCHLFYPLSTSTLVASREVNASDQRTLPIRGLGKNFCLIVHVANFLCFSEVNVPDHLVELFFIYCLLKAPAFANEPVHFEGVVDTFENTHSLVSHCLKVVHKFSDAVVLMILALEVEFHHLNHESESLLQ